MVFCIGKIITWKKSHHPVIQLLCCPTHHPVISLSKASTRAQMVTIDKALQKLATLVLLVLVTWRTLVGIALVDGHQPIFIGNYIYNNNNK